MNSELKIWRAVLAGLIFAVGVALPGAYIIHSLALGNWLSFALVIATAIAIAAGLVYGLVWLIDHRDW